MTNRHAWRRETCFSCFSGHSLFFCFPPMIKTNKLTRASISLREKRWGRGGGTRETCRLSDRELLPSTVSDGPILKCIRVLSLLRTPHPTHCPCQLDMMAKIQQLRNERFPLSFKVDPASTGLFSFTEVSRDKNWTQQTEHLIDLIDQTEANAS